MNNHYIDMFQPVIDACKTREDYTKAYLRISSCIAGMILGRAFDQSFDNYLANNPTKQAFHKWWMAIKDNLHAKCNF